MTRLRPTLESALESIKCGVDAYAENGCEGESLFVNAVTMRLIKPAIHEGKLFGLMVYVRDVVDNVGIITPNQKYWVCDW